MITTNVIINRGGCVLTAEVSRSPFNVNAAYAAFLRVRRDRRAKAFAVAALVASARVEHAPIDIVVHGDVRMTRLEHGRFE